MATAATIGDMTVEEAEGLYYIVHPRLDERLHRVGGFRSLEAAKLQARAAWNVALLKKLTEEAGRMSLASEGTTDRLMRALDGLSSK
ncbi:MAG: hypothetical protein BGO49_11510 [Planctomycetales bacterium 71-10]|nr:MAG: hypothetical protein BGO49_11510 [Planctomycetales bacterium 71-10]